MNCIKLNKNFRIITCGGFISPSVLSEFRKCACAVWADHELLDLLLNIRCLTLKKINSVYFVLYKIKHRHRKKKERKISASNKND